MLRKLSKCIYTAEATVQEGRQDHGPTSDGVLDLDIRLPHFFPAFGCEQILALNLFE